LEKQARSGSNAITPTRNKAKKATKYAAPPRACQELR